MPSLLAWIMALETVALCVLIAVCLMPINRDRSATMIHPDTVKAWEAENQDFRNLIRAQREKIERLRAENEKFRAALKVFGEIYKEEELRINREGPQIGDADPEPKL